MSKAGEIASGYYNLLKSKVGLSSEEDKKIFGAKREICNACEHRTEEDVCELCGCPLEAKTKSKNKNSKCPKGYW